VYTAIHGAYAPIPHETYSREKAPLTGGGALLLSGDIQLKISTVVAITQTTMITMVGHGFGIGGLRGQVRIFAGVAMKLFASNSERFILDFRCVATTIPHHLHKYHSYLRIPQCLR
jgi:hypothetical protein